MRSIRTSSYLFIALFISDDRNIGGHILDFSLDSATVSLDETLTFMMRLPADGGF